MQEQIKYRIVEQTPKGLFEVKTEYASFGFRVMVDGSIRLFKGKSYIYQLCDVPQVDGVPRNPCSVYSPYCEMYEDLIEKVKGVTLGKEVELSISLL